MHYTFLTNWKILFKNWSISQLFEQLSLLLEASNIWAHVDLTIDLYNKKFSIFMERELFFKFIPICNVRWYLQ